MVLRGLENALARHPLNDGHHDDRLDSLAELHDLRAQQVELLAR